MYRTNSLAAYLFVTVVATNASWLLAADEKPPKDEKQGAEDQPPDSNDAMKNLSIQIALEKKEYELGSSIPLVVRFSNRGQSTIETVFFAYSQVIFGSYLHLNVKSEDGKVLDFKIQPPNTKPPHCLLVPILANSTYEIRMTVESNADLEKEGKYQVRLWYALSADDQAKAHFVDKDWEMDKHFNNRTCIGENKSNLLTFELKKR